MIPPEMLASFMAAGVMVAIFGVVAFWEAVQWWRSGRAK